MSREYKVMAWNGEKMSKPINPYNDNSFWFSEDEEDDAIFVSDSDLSGLERFEYIGEKDFRGKEIYEGHILQRLSEKGKFYVVVWRDFGFKLEYKFIRKYEEDTLEESTFLPIYPDSYEVIGHIKENPDISLVN
ncbi:YopX family protein [Bacillus mexicanus]|uniref:YopX family protein n=1 Tax=Bacillus mexicanus TaxID=2834415 RepID=UPI003D24BF0A